MKFDRLRIVGFKTFVDPTEVPILSGLTGIVGPNGCGKSNLVEAMRWAMGENSHKSLRGSGMDDVIFSGSGTRPSRNTAEVSLLLDNSDRLAPAQFNDSDQLEISRRIEREAGSAYRINGKDVRARDVQILFADAATGAHSPALVRQGQIGELIAAKPAQRRRILEDAAGIAGLHARRHEAELRLRAAESNLERLDDVISQIASQLESLKRQARQANRYRVLSGEIRKVEASVLHLRWADARDEITRHGKAQEEAVRAVGERMKAAAVAETARADAQNALPQLRENEAKAAAILRHVTLMRDQLQEEADRAAARQGELEQRIVEIRRDREREASAISDAGEALERLGTEAEGLKAQEPQTGDGGEALREAETRTEAQLRELEAELSQLQADAADLTARREQLERVIRTESERLTRLAGQIGDIEAETNTLNEKQARAASEAGNPAEAVEQARAALEASERAAEEATAAVTAAQERERNAAEPVREIEQSIRSLDAEKRTLDKILAVDGADLFAPVIDSVSAAPGYETALGAAMGDDLSVPADEGAVIHWRQVAPGETDPALPDGCEPLSKHVRGPAVLARRLSQIGVVDADNGPAMQKLLKPGQRLVSRAGDLWRWDGYTAAAEAKTPAAVRLEQQNRLAELADEITSASAKLDDAKAEAQEASSALAQARAAEEEARRTRRSTQSALSDAQEALAKAERAAAQDVARLSALAEAQVRINSSIAESETAKKSAIDALTGFEDDEALQGRITTLKERVNDARGKYAEARAAAQSHARETAMRAQRLAAIERESAQWTKRRDDANAQNEALVKRAEELSAERDELARIPEEIKSKRDRLNVEIGESEGKRRGAADALAEAESVLREADRGVREADAAVAEAREAQARGEATLEGLRQRLADIEEHILETLECAPSEVFAMTGYGPDDTLPERGQLERTLEQLKRDRDRLGAVNLRAEIESEEAQKEHDGLVSEKADLEQAIARLRQGIASLNKEGRERLLASFSTVNNHFQRLFTTLFGGGTAELKLEGSDDPLEAGLEIIARPPGKRPQVLTLLSGGEQALTATALIFAVFLTNPSPICVLDEVDAPLDDANVERFCDLMEEMVRSTETRFLLITHNPITMARMDRLFGVTMGERGVSQLVSVDLSEAEQLREAG
ncbi:chromosome segregation SMC family protein [Tepidamorphus sp. 3E244]|uniref:chromosome segregation SMC family protein n=1 Tax=Tepidamorphus sp. 3E244 TaxID=3385498 RepID=UPI0038FD0ECA